MVPRAAKACLISERGLRTLALAAGTSLVAAWVAAQPRGIERAAFLQGCWATTANGRTIEEHWMAPKGRTMIGIGRTTSDDRLLDHELVILKEDGDRLAYEAHPSGQATAVFLSVNIEPDALLFENPQHDFPQRVGYRKSGTRLTAWVEGNRNGQLRRIEFPYERVPCANP